MKSIIILSVFLVCSALAASSDKDTESKVARYLKSCGVITSLKTTKCVKVGFIKLFKQASIVMIAHAVLILVEFQTWRFITVVLFCCTCCISNYFRHFNKKNTFREAMK